MKFCKKPGCPNTVETGFCPEHTKTPVERSEKVTDPFYLSVRWRRLRERFISGHPLCSCGQPAVIVHHKRGIKDDPSLAMAESNLEVVCRACHNDLHPRKQGTRGKRVYSYKNLKRRKQ
jgi:5-methylcytosine-specific restriction enzyme A